MYERDTAMRCNCKMIGWWERKIWKNEWTNARKNYVTTTQLDKCIVIRHRVLLNEEYGALQNLQLCSLIKKKVIKVKKKKN